MLACLDLATKAFGSWPTFVELFGGVKGQWGGTEWGKPDPSVPERMRKVSLRRTRIEVLPQLPVKTWRTHRVAIDKATQKLCDDATGELAKVGVRLDDAKDLAKITAVKGAGFELLSKARLALAAVKLPAAVELVEELEEQEEPVLVFASHRGPIEVLGKREGWACITGGTSDVERKRLNDAFQAGQLKGLALTIQAGGTALTLTRAAQVIFIDRAWTPALNEQAEDRVCRIGATRGIVITIMEANHAIDYRVNELLLLKQDLVDGTLGGSR
jgi:SNF2 family DNA or RNA helicase